MKGSTRKSEGWYKEVPKFHRHGKRNEFGLTSAGETGSLHRVGSAAGPWVIKLSGTAGVEFQTKKNIAQQKRCQT